MQKLLVTAPQSGNIDSEEESTRKGAYDIDIGQQKEDIENIDLNRL